MEIFTQEQKNILNISPNESKVLDSLKNIKSIFTLSKDTKIPRTTLYPIIKNLCQRGFIKKEIRGSRFEYHSVAPDVLGNIFEKIGLDLIKTNEKSKPQIVVEVNNSPVVIEKKEVAKKRRWFKFFFS